MPEQKRYTNIIIIAVLFLVILGLILYIIFSKKPVETIDTSKIKELRDSVQLIQHQVDTLDDENSRLRGDLKYLNSLPPKIKFIYDTQKKQLPGLNSDQLDSTIRTNSGLTIKRHK